MSGIPQKIRSKLYGLNQILGVNMMKRYQKFNPKRRLAQPGTYTCAKLAELAESVRYSGNPEHKKNPGDFGLTPPAQARRGKTLCDTTKITSRDDALGYLRLGLERGAVSEQTVDDWPKIVWAVTDDGIPLEAQRDRAGTYHGYPMPPEDPMATEIVRFWNQNG